MTHANPPLTREHVVNLYGRGLLDLVYTAADVHRAHHDPATIQCASLLSVKTGGCPEDCAYCPQSAHHDAGVEAEKLMPLAEVVEAAPPGALARTVADRARQPNHITAA